MVALFADPGFPAVRRPLIFTEKPTLRGDVGRQRDGVAPHDHGGVAGSVPPHRCLMSSVVSSSLGWRGSRMLTSWASPVPMFFVMNRIGDRLPRRSMAITEDIGGRGSLSLKFGSLGKSPPQA